MNAQLRLVPDQPTLMPDGIYFGLPADQYHDDPALGSTDIKNLLSHPGTYWWNSKMNPLYPQLREEDRKPTKSKMWGTAFHSIICEGQKVFERRYFRGPSKADYPDLMVTMDDMKVWLRRFNYSTEGNKDKLIRRVLDSDPEAPVWDEIVRKAQVLAGDRIVLDPSDYDSIVVSSKMITKNPSCTKAFQGGYPEVSVFWTQDGIRLKGRFDYLRFRAVVDLKSFRNWANKPMDVAVFNAIANYRYDIQAAHYVHARQMIPQLIKAGKVFGEVSSAWLDRLVAAKDFRYVWIFYHAEDAPIAKRFDYLPDAPYHEAAEYEIRTAFEKYRRHMEVFGDMIWVDVSEPHILATEDLPSWMGLSN